MPSLAIRYLFLLFWQCWMRVSGMLFSRNSFTNALSYDFILCKAGQIYNAILMIGAKFNLRRRGLSPGNTDELGCYIGFWVSGGLKFQSFLIQRYHRLGSSLR